MHFLDKKSRELLFIRKDDGVLDCKFPILQILSDSEEATLVKECLKLQIFELVISSFSAFKWKSNVKSPLIVYS